MIDFVMVKATQRNYCRDVRVTDHKLVQAKLNI